MWALQSASTRWNPVERFIFPAPRSSYTCSSFPRELILVPREDGQQVPCLLLPFRHARFLLMYFHGNADDLGLCRQFCEHIRDQFQVHVLAVEYPGYGVCDGPCDEEGITANAEAAMKFVTLALQWPLDAVLIMGRSLGTGPAVALAARWRVAGLILVSPYLSIREIFRFQVGNVADFLVERFPNCERIDLVSSATLIIHGRQDALIPHEHGELLFKRMRVRKLMVSPADMAHNTPLLSVLSYFVLPMIEFFSLPDYTFEDLEVPEWAYMSDDAMKGPPRAPRGPSCAFSDASTDVPEWGESAPFAPPTSSQRAFLEWVRTGQSVFPGSQNASGSGPLGPSGGSVHPLAFRKSTEVCDGGSPRTRMRWDSIGKSIDYLVERPLMDHCWSVTAWPCPAG